MSKRISLTEKDFDILVRGGIVERDNVQIALKDIGFYRMRKIVLAASYPSRVLKRKRKSE